MGRATRGAVVGALAVGAMGFPAVGAAEQPAGCTAEDVSVRLGTVVYQSRTSYAPAIITAADGVECTLTGFADGFLFADGTGNPLSTNPSEVGTADETVTLGPGAPAHVGLTWQSYPSGPEPLRPATLSFSLPGAGGASTLEWTGGDVYGAGSLAHNAVAAGDGEQDPAGR